MPLYHLLKFKSFYGELICQAFEQFALVWVARAHTDEKRGLGAKLVQSIPEVLHVLFGSGPNHVNCGVAYSFNPEAC